MMSAVWILLAVSLSLLLSWSACWLDGTTGMAGDGTDPPDLQQDYPPPFPIPMSRRRCVCGVAAGLLGLAAVLALACYGQIRF